MAAANKTTKTVKVDPNWGQMFLLGEQLIKDADFDGKAFVLEMYQFGARCYESLNIPLVDVDASLDFQIARLKDGWKLL